MSSEQDYHFLYYALQFSVLGEQDQELGTCFTSVELVAAKANINHKQCPNEKKTPLSELTSQGTGNF